MARYKVESEGRQYSVEVVDHVTGGGTVKIEDREFKVEFVGGEARSAARIRPVASIPRPVVEEPERDGSVVAPIHGKVIAIHVGVGDEVSADQAVLTLEAMKMENEITAPISGIVQEITVSEGADAAGDQLLMRIGR